MPLNAGRPVDQQADPTRGRRDGEWCFYGNQRRESWLCESQKGERCLYRDHGTHVVNQYHTLRGLPPRVKPPRTIATTS